MHGGRRVRGFVLHLCRWKSLQAPGGEGAEAKGGVPSSGEAQDPNDPGSSGARDVPAPGSTLLSPPESEVCFPALLFLGTLLVPSLPGSRMLPTSRFCAWSSARLGDSKNVLRTATLLACDSLGEPVAQSRAHARMPSVLSLVLPLLLRALPAPYFAHLLLRRAPRASTEPAAAQRAQQWRGVLERQRRGRGHCPLPTRYWLMVVLHLRGDHLGWTEHLREQGFPTGCGGILEFLFMLACS